MGRKGVSKRKTSQAKSKTSSGDTAGGSVSSVVRASENQPARSLDTGKGSTKSTSTEKKKSRKD